MSEAVPLSRVVDAMAIRPEGTELSVTATEEERRAIARRLGLLDLTALTAALSLKRNAKGQIHVTGRLHADLVQACVVSLEPVPQTIDEEIDRRFVPESAAPPPTEAKEVEIAVDAEDEPDTYARGRLDLGPVVLEEMILGLDPYPRAPGAELPADLDEAEDRRESAFAILKSIGHSDRT